MVPADVNGKSSIMSQRRVRTGGSFRRRWRGTQQKVETARRASERASLPSPPVPTADEIAQREAEEEQKKALAGDWWACSNGKHRKRSDLLRDSVSERTTGPSPKSQLRINHPAAATATSLA